jgi:glycosyltransferase involved in cell wall biosynthesis
MATGKPLVSVGMPVYNEAQWIRQSLDALLAQTFGDFELIISDNASTDGTWDILQEYAKDSRIVLYHQLETLGAMVHFQFVLEQASGDYFMWASGHDLWSASLLQALVGEMQANPDVVLCAPHGILIDEEGRPIRSFDDAIDTRAAKSAAGRVLALRRQMGRGNAFYGLYRRHILMQTLPWLKIVASDNIILIRIASWGQITTNQSAQWFRRKNRQETSQLASQRRVTALGLSGLAAKFPYLASRVAIMLEFLKVDGSYREKIALLAYELRTLFLRPSQRQLLIKEFLSGISTSILYSLKKHSTEAADNYRGSKDVTSI